MNKTQNISAKEAQQLLAQPDCIKDEELSAIVRRDVYQLPDGRVLLYLNDEVMEVVYESKEALIEVMSETR